jgi:hypothetical protein
VRGTKQKTKNCKRPTAGVINPSSMADNGEHPDGPTTYAVVGPALASSSGYCWPYLIDVNQC